MPPVLLIVAVGRSKRFPIPFPVILLWPFVLLGWILLGIVWFFLPKRSSAARFVLIVIEAIGCFWHLSGLKIDITSHDETGVYILII